MKKIAIFGTPRSGTSWIGQLFNSSPDVIYRFQPLFSYAFKNFLGDTPNEARINEFFSLLAESDDPFVCQADKQVTFIKNDVPTHICFKEARYLNVCKHIVEQTKDVKLLFIIRNPLQVIHSWFKAPKEFEPNWNRLEEWRTGRKKNLNHPENFYGFDAWMQTTKEFVRLEQEYPEQCIIVTYADLFQDTLKEIKRLFSFCEIELSTQTVKFINQSSDHDDGDPYGVFRDHITMNQQWKTGLETEIIQAITEEISNSELQRYLD